MGGAVGVEPLQVPDPGVAVAAHLLLERQVGVQLRREGAGEAVGVHDRAPSGRSSTHSADGPGRRSCTGWSIPGRRGPAPPRSSAAGPLRAAAGRGVVTQQPGAGLHVATPACRTFRLSPGRWSVIGQPDVGCHRTQEDMVISRAGPLIQYVVGERADQQWSAAPSAGCSSFAARSRSSVPASRCCPAAGRRCRRLVGPSSTPAG